MWNVRGVGGGCKNLTFQKLMREKKQDFFGLVETKHTSIKERRGKGWWDGVEINSH